MKPPPERASDLSGATQLAIKMVTEWGRPPARTNWVRIGRTPQQAGPVFGQERPYAEGTQQVIDQEVSRLLSEAEDRARALLSDHRAALDAVIAALLEKETISGDDLADIVKRSQRVRVGHRRSWGRSRAAHRRQDTSTSVAIV